MRRKRTKAITLLELLVVVGILAVLLGLLTPAYIAIRESARIAQCRARLHQIGLAIRAFRQDHRGHDPQWLSNLYPRYLESQDLLLCLSDTSRPKGSGVDPDNNLRPYRDPKLACSYLYEFNPLPWPLWFPEPDFPGQPNDLSWREVKTRSLRVYGNRVPIVRCLWHSHRLGAHQHLNLAYDGSVYQHDAGVSWTKVIR